MAKVAVRINGAGAMDLCLQDAVESLLLSKAEELAARADARVGDSDKYFDNPNFVAASKKLTHTAVARVSAANPRSDWYAKNRGALDF